MGHAQGNSGRIGARADGLLGHQPATRFLELLCAFLDVFPEAPVHVCRNLYFGEPEKFERCNDSKTKMGFVLNPYGSSHESL